MTQARRMRTALLAGFILAGGLAAIRAMAQSTSAEPLVAGVLFPLTGDAADWGTKGRKGLQLATDELNASSACGRSVTAIYEDSQADPTIGLSAFQKLISADRVPVVIGDIVSSVTLAIAPAAQRAKVVVLSPTASAPAITYAGDYIYRIWPSDNAEAKVIANYAIQRGFRRVAILYMNNDYGSGIQNAFTTDFEGDGRRVISAESYLQTNQDFRSALSKIQGQNADVLYVAGYYADSALVVRQARELGLSFPILGTTSVDDPKFIEIAGKAAEGVVYPLATGYDATSSDPLVREFIDSFQRRFNQIPGWIEAQAYDAMGVICRASQKITGTPTGTAIKQGLDNLGTYNGVTGTIKFDQNGDVVKPIRLRVVRDGRFVNLDQ